ncbi:MAG: amidohydrolase family protein [Pseudomonadales bacterium]
MSRTGTRSTRLALPLAVLTTCLTTASCTETTPESAAPRTEPAVSAQVAPAAAPAAASTAGNGRRLSVTVSEATNLSFALSPDRQTLVLSVQGVLFAVPVSGGEGRPLTPYLFDAREPDWKPDGSGVVFHGYRNGTWDLWFQPLGGDADPQALTSDPFDDREAAVSPGGTRVAFSSDRGGNYDIWLLTLADGSLTRVTDSPYDESAPVFSPDGARVAFAAAAERGHTEIREVELATGNQRTVTVEEGTITGIAWHPDGDRLSYQVTRPGRTWMSVVRTDGSRGETLSQTDDDVFPFRAVWLDDTTSLYAANGVIYRQVADGSRSQVPFTATFELERPPYERRRRDHDDTGERAALGIARPHLSPDGAAVTFSALGDVWLWQPKGEQLTNLTNSPWADHSPRFAPDGQRIAYVSDRPGANGATSTPGLWIYDLGRQTHTHVPAIGGGVTGPAWSPDGDAIALFVSVPGNPLGAQLTVVDLADGSSTPLYKPVPAQTVSWSSDGAYVATTELVTYSGRYREGTYHLTALSPTTGERYQVEPVPHKSITDAALGPSGQFVSYVQDGQLWRLNLTEDFRAAGYPEPLTAMLTDSPAWSAGGRYVVFMSGDRMLKLNVSSGATEDITPRIPWRPALLNARWTLKIGRLFTGTGDAYRENVLVTIDGNRILSIEPATAETVADRDFSDKAAFPGLFEMHAHLGEISESQGRAWLAWGVTSVRDPGAHPYVAKERQEYWDSGQAPGPRTHVTGYLLDGNRVYYSVAEGIASDIHLERDLERAQKLKLDFLKTYVRLPDHRQKRVVEFAHGIGIPVSSHELFPAVAQGMDHVEHIGGTSRRGYAPKVSALGRSYDDVVQLLTKSGMGITPTVVLPGYALMASEAPDLFATPQFRAFYGEAGQAAAAGIARMFGGGVPETVAGNAELLRKLADADALMVTGTDSPFVPYGAGLHAELRLYARAGLTPAQILRAATAVSARAAGVSQDIGTLAPGMIADLVIVDGDPLADIADADNVVMTIKHGRAYPLDRLLGGPEPR